MVPSGFDFLNDSSVFLSEDCNLNDCKNAMEMDAVYLLYEFYFRTQARYMVPSGFDF